MHHDAGHSKPYTHCTLVSLQSSFPWSSVILTIAILPTHNTVCCFAFPIFEHVCLAIESIWINQYHGIHLWLFSSSAVLYLSHFWGTQRMVPQLLVFTRVCSVVHSDNVSPLSEYRILPPTLLTYRICKISKISKKGSDWTLNEKVSACPSPLALWVIWKSGEQHSWDQREDVGPRGVTSWFTCASIPQFTRGGSIALGVRMCAEKLPDALIQLMLVDLRFVASQFCDDGEQIILTQEEVCGRKQDLHNRGK